MEIKQEVDIKSTPKVKKESKTKPKKLRSLLNSETKLKVEHKIDTKIEKLFSYKWILVITVFALIAVLLSNTSFSSCGFWATYESNFHKIVHGDENFCYRTLDPEPIYDELKRQIVGQNDAIRLVKGSLALANREWIIQIAFYGTTGVGKTLSSNIIMQNFKWQRNVISTIFDINFQVNLTGKDAFASDLKLLKSKLSACGFNLIVIDDVDWNPATIQRINAIERNLHRMAKLFKIVLIVIFNSEAKADLKNFVNIEFERFTEKSFHECIDLHQKLKNVELKPSEVEELRMINFTISGCKTVAKKINLIAKS